MTHLADQETPITDPRPGLPGWVVPLAITVLALALVAIALTRSNPEFDRSTPEGTVQIYLVAIGDSRWDDALAVLDPEFFGNCEASDLAAEAPPTFTAKLEGTTHGTSRTTVDVALQFGTPGLINGSWGYTVEFVTMERAGQWLITDHPWPYIRWRCERTR